MAIDSVYGQDGDDLLSSNDDQGAADRLDGGSNGPQGDDCHPSKRGVVVNCER
ncbi:hypothetical protein [Krasilnikovia sp. MM14-A1259]|uniref:hypothetical protein n=1 Tax=Krasilnikovia sp. MM14-A1259 TaxID=3373539 RepID=UPI00399CEF03